LNQLVIHKVESKLSEIQKKRSMLSTELAEKEHHETCEYECCGEHNDFADFDQCPVCKMTPEIQEQHNEQWWACVDEIEGNDDDCNRYCTIEHFLEEWLNKERKNDS